MTAPVTPPEISPFWQIEGCLTLILVGFAFALPGVAEPQFRRGERLFGSLARRKRAAVASVGFAAILLRLLILPFFPIPLPFLPDDFSFLLGADTFLHGRLANPTPPFWQHFENIQITVVPTYVSMYFPGPSLALAVGKLLFGHPWFAVLLTTAFNLLLTRPITPGPLIAEGKWVSGRRRVFVAEARLLDGEGEECARGTGTFMRSHIPLAGLPGYRLGE